MPFKIVRNDITRVRADAIVNAASPQPCGVSGTEAAVYKAAGADKLLAERKKIGRIAPGEAGATAAFHLPAKYIIHTAGPSWADGQHGESDLLRSCYRKSLLLAEQLGCRSIACPLIAGDAGGLPKEQALKIALSAIREYLEDSDLEVTLVISGESSCQLATGLTEQVEAYLDEHYAAERAEEACGGPPEGGSESKRRRGLQKHKQDLCRAFLNNFPADAMAVPGEKASEEADTSCFRVAEAAASYPVPKTKKAALEDAVNHLGESFQLRLLRMIDERGMTDPEVYKRANVDRKLFSKIRCRKDYLPKK